MKLVTKRARKPPQRYGEWVEQSEIREMDAAKALLELSRGRTFVVTDKLDQIIGHSLFDGSRFCLLRSDGAIWFDWTPEKSVALGQNVVELYT